MHIHPDLLRQVSADRQQELRAEAAAQRLADSVRARTCFAHVLRRAADRLDAATSPCAHVRRVLAQRG